MADSGALRVRRARAHKAGDHSLCRRCQAVVKPRSVAAVADLPPGIGEVTDAPSELRQLAWRMAEAHRADPANAILGRELRVTLLALIPKGDEKADADLAGLFGALQA
jgi:hypothetical protein